MLLQNEMRTMYIGVCALAHFNRSNNRAADGNGERRRVPTPQSRFAVKNSSDQLVQERHTSQVIRGSEVTAAKEIRFNVPVIVPQRRVR